MWRGEPVAADPARYRAVIDYAGHLDAIKPALTLGETLRFWAALRGVANPESRERSTGSGSAPLRDWPCRYLSAGQRRRLALARLVAAPAAIWLLDEPTAALDSDGEVRLMEAIAEHRAAGGRIAVATHLPLPLPGAETIRLDDYAVSPHDALASPW